MRKRSALSPAVLLAVGALGFAAAPALWQKEQPAQWTTEDVYQILNNSPWSRSTGMTAVRNRSFEDASNSRDGGAWGEIPAGPMGRGGNSGPFGSGHGIGSGRNDSPTNETDVTVQWASALPVRLAVMRINHENLDPANLKPLDDYVIAVLNLPKAALMSQMGADPNEIPDDKRLIGRLKSISFLIRRHQRLSPTEVELNQGRDGRTIFHFAKADPITLDDKDVEFRIATDTMDLRRRFVLKDMMYLGNLAL